MNLKKLVLPVALLAMFGLSFANAQESAAQSNVGPPAGAILDLNGTPIPGHGNGTTYQNYTVNFTANVPNTAITFTFREDPAFISFDNVSVVDLTHPGANLLVNGNFEGGTYTNNGNTATPIGWTYANIFGAAAGGRVTSISNGTQGWFDGAVQAYDAISQSIPTTIGDLYRISFDLADNSSLGTFSALSTNGNVTDSGGNGIDVLAFAQAGLPTPNPPSSVPEPCTMLLLGAGMLGAMAAKRRKAKQS